MDPVSFMQREVSTVFHAAASMRRIPYAPDLAHALAHAFAHAAHTRMRTRVRAQVSQLVATDVEYKDRLFVGNVHLVRMRRTTDGTAFRRRHYTRRTLRVPRGQTE